MNPSEPRLQNLTPPEWFKLFHGIALKHEFSTLVVGGIVRDALRGEKPGTDWDLELQHSKAKAPWDKLVKDLAAHFKLTPQAHNVIKAYHPDSKSEFEFAPPRIENYASSESSHADFESTVAFSLPFGEAAIRRDFTVNAIAAKWTGSEWEMLDPFNGLADIRGKKLRACSATHFVRDPVRYLRAIRFALNFGWHISPELLELMEGMDLSSLSHFYVGLEAKKSLKPFEFWNALQRQPTLPQKFQGGLQNALGLQAVYAKHLPSAGFSNALLAAVFTLGEGWHLLLPLGGKGESETSMWRNRRNLILKLRSKVPSDFGEDFKTSENDENFIALTQLMRFPLQWLEFPWVRDVIKEMGLEWIFAKSWPSSASVQSHPPHERNSRRVLAWLHS